VKAVLISTYELGRQPFGLASPAAWLRGRGHEVVCADLSVSAFPQAAVREAELVAFYVPMHTATRLAVKAIERVRELNATAVLCAYGLYAPINAELLRGLGVTAIIGGEFESALAELADGRKPEQSISLERLQFAVPDRAGLPNLGRYARLRADGGDRIAGATEASRGCKHLCRHCPIVPVYQGTFRVVQQEVVLADIRGQVEAGAQHITFGDPDFFNGPTHAMRIVEALHCEFPNVSYDVTIKIEHLLKHRDLIPRLRDAGCAFVTSAIESVDDATLLKLEKGHTRADFIETAGLFRRAGLNLNPTFIPFTPWTTLDGYRDLLRVLHDVDLVENTSPIQLAIRLLITSGSRLLELEEIRAIAQPFRGESLAYPWKHQDPAVDELARQVLRVVNEGQNAGRDRRSIFSHIWALAHSVPLPENFELMPRATVPYLDEPWYC
jgi:radical SAM superfamily enzyme YgiQ (UPF0313 family)